MLLLVLVLLGHYEHLVVMLTQFGQFLLHEVPQSVHVLNGHLIQLWIAPLQAIAIDMEESRRRHMILQIVPNAFLQQ